MKATFFYHWRDLSQSHGKETRNRVAYLLRAARSRPDTIKKLSNGYRIGGTLDLVRNQEREQLELSL